MTHDFRKLCQKVYDFANGQPPYDFSRLSRNDRGNAQFDALNVIMEEIRAALKDTENQPTDEFSSLADKIIEKVRDQTDNDVVIDFSNLEETLNAYTYKIISTVLQTIAYNCHEFCFGDDHNLDLFNGYDLFKIRCCITGRLDTIARRISEVSPSQDNNS
jgi:hypothetical protein